MDTESGDAAGAAEIRRLNDAFREDPTQWNLAFSAGIDALPRSDREAILQRIFDFDACDEDNDPWNEHDYGSFEYGEERIIWKIDYYDLILKGHSEDPADPKKTIRMLSVMLGHEY